MTLVYQIVLCFSLPIVSGFLQSFNYDKSEGPLVLTNYGLVEGFIMESETNRRFFAFQGIPYAKPPLRQLRFKLPVAIEPWNGTLKAFRERNCCVQPGLIDSLKGIFGNEDCLYLNIYTPKLPSRNKDHLLPVLLVIHGGAFIGMAGSTFFYGPKKFVDYDIIMVNFNYRLGPLGFLSTGDEASPGNYGLFDQLMVLKWVKENIRYFGGNPDSVTLMGNSAGAMSITAHMVSPLSKGLFHRVILHSGVITVPRMINEEPLKMTKAFSEAVGCSTTSTQQIIDCLRKQNAETLCDVAIKISFPYVMMVLPRFVPVVDGLLLPKHPQTLFEKGDFHKVPIIAGINKDEGMIFYEIEMQITKEDNETRFLEDFQIRFLTTFSSSLEEAQKKFPKVSKEYLEKKDFHCLKRARTKMNQVINDVVFNLPIINFLKMVYPIVPTYMFHLRYRMAFGFPEIMDFKDKDVVAHGDDVPFFFDGFYSVIKKSQQEMDLSHKLQKLWTNFIIFGNPSVNQEPLQWDPINSDAIDYLDITEKLTMKSNYKSENIIRFVNDNFLDKMKLGPFLSLNIDKKQFVSEEFKMRFENEICNENNVS